jgi:hypothetical protein
MCDEAATAAEKAAPITRALVAVCICTCASAASAQLSDPMAPPGVVSPYGAQPGLRSGTPSELQGIISGPGRRLALINGNVVQVGETIPGNGELLNVGPDTATVRSGEKNILLRLHPDLRKKDAAP